MPEAYLVPRGTAFEDAVARLKTQPPIMRKELVAGVRQATKPIKRKLQEAVLGLNSAAVGGGGSKQRDALARSKFQANQLAAFRSAALGNAKVARRTVRQYKTGNVGLRAGIARGVAIKISTGGRRIGVRVRATGDGLPAAQRVLVKATNRGKVRHPVFGDRKAWVNQTFTPPGWFDKTVTIFGPDAVKKIEAVARYEMGKLQS